MTRVRRVTPIDALERDGERIVLVPGHVVRVAGIAPAILDLTADWISVPDLVDAVEREVGGAPAGQARTAVEAAVRHLLDQGLLERTDP